MRIVSAPRPSDATPSFTSTIRWEDRSWLYWERMLFSMFQRPIFGAVMLCTLIVPLSILTVPLMPLVSLALLKAPPQPSGEFEVGLSDMQKQLTLDGGSSTTLRLRVFYPAAQSSGVCRRAVRWLPAGPAGARYAVQHGQALPLPKWLRHIFAGWLTCFLRFANLPTRMSKVMRSHSAGRG